MKLRPDFTYGFFYRIRMRIAHRLGYCYVPDTQASPEPGYVWCHWCGMRGKRPLPTAEMVEQMQAAMRDQP
jgi:hypothetical protein